MNLEQLQKLNDAELNELSAVKVMGYHMYHYNKDVEENCYYLLMGGLDAVNPVSRGFKTEKEAWRDWNPTTDMNDAMELLKHIPDYRVELVFEKELSFTCSVFEDDIVCLFSVDSENPARAITIASILAKE